MKAATIVWAVLLFAAVGAGPAVGTPGRSAGRSKGAQPDGAQPAPAAEPGPRPGAASGHAGAAPLVVIDPGHGGTNAGAPGVERGVYEKHVTLALSRRLAADLRARGVRVMVTRDRDEYLTLRRRVQLANAAGADAFVSVHANATAGHGQRGYETYLLTPRALDVDARALRRDDGPRRPGPGGGASGVDRDTALLIDDLERGAAHRRAADIAAAIQGALRSVRGPDGDRGVKQASMDVLLGAHMPAVLVEVGFIDHAVEGPELGEPEVRARIGAALGDAIAAAVQKTDGDRLSDPL